ncbi:hypothetical protein GGX14DRAFT_401713 [Mycena pura]|uniref:Uncharacterized protein n=1 Tax=Mycena pura TaxID=153505 RepID=A0AAD6UZ53_9AGAR|nr:hypothetical protein GGX14DRAFT_401713 [Mycena pura]
MPLAAKARISPGSRSAWASRDPFSTRQPAGSGWGFCGSGSGSAHLYPDPDPCSTLGTSVLGRDILGGHCMAASSGRDISVGAGHFRGTAPWWGRRHCLGGTSVLGWDILGGHCMAASSGRDISVGAGHFRGTVPWRHHGGGTSVLGRDILGGHCMVASSGRDISVGAGHFRGTGDSALAGAAASSGRDISVGVGHFRGTVPWRHHGGGTSVLGRDILGGHCMVASSGRDISVGAGHFRGTAPWQGRWHRLGGTSVLGRDILGGHCMAASSGRDISVGAGHLSTWHLFMTQHSSAPMDLVTGNWWASNVRLFMFVPSAKVLISMANPPFSPPTCNEPPYGQLIKRLYGAGAVVAGVETRLMNAVNARHRLMQCLHTQYWVVYYEKNTGGLCRKLKRA